LSAIFIASIFAFLGASIPSWLGLPHSFWAMPIGAVIGFTIGRYVLSRIAIPALRPFYHEFIK
jgi:membrane protein DedA with SNARE-associated domain